MISLKQIHYAIAVSKTKHFKKAAEMCSVSQSALSSAITELESQLKIQLFERDNKKVLITPIGEQFLAKAHEIKLCVEDLMLLSQSQHELFSHPISVGVIPTIGPYLLPKVLPGIRAEYDKIQLSIVEDQSHVLVDKVRNGELDTAILALPYALDGLLSFEFWEEDFYFITHELDEQAKQCDVHDRQCCIASADIDPDKLMLLEDGHCLKDHVLAVCQFSKFRTNHTFSGASLYTLIQMVASKMGTTLLPEMALDQLVNNSNELSAVRLDEPSPHRRLALICRVNYPRVDQIQALISLFRKQLLKPSP